MADIFIYPRNDDTGTSASRSEDVARIEDKANAHLPTDYRKFLVDYGGGFAWPQDLHIADDKLQVMLGQDTKAIFEFFATDIIEGHLNREVFYNSTPDGFLLIADANGPLVVLSVRPADYGQIFIWNPNSMPWGEPGNDDTALGALAPDFASLINALTDLSGEGPGKRSWERGGRRAEARKIEL